MTRFFLHTRAHTILQMSKSLLRVNVLAVPIAFGISVGSAAADGLFSDGFERGNGGAWTSVNGNDTYSSNECRSGNFCGAQTVPGGRCDQGAYWRTRVDYSGNKIYARAWWKFPTGYSFTNSLACKQSTDHKAIIFETDNRADRCFVKFFGGSGNKAPIIFSCDNSDPKRKVHRIGGSGAFMVADGKWHQVEVQITRTPGSGSIEMWHDGRKFIDGEYYRVCTNGCPKITDVKFGAYVNYALSKTQTFFMDDIVVATQRGGEGSTNRPAPPVLLNVE